LSKKTRRGPDKSKRLSYSPFSSPTFPGLYENPTEGADREAMEKINSTTPPEKKHAVAKNKTWQKLL
jgi:hypothetical protein